MVHIELTVLNDLGFHARAAGRFVKEAAGFNCDIWLAKGVNKVNGKSIMGILTLAAAKGERIIIEADGADEKEALDVLSRLVKDGFGEVKNKEERREKEEGGIGNGE
jgi:phosphocarrier protein HPr